jgi:hypothetical protein
VSVAATWIAMGYLPISARHGSCVNCCKCESSPAGLRCTLGGFYVNRMGGCRLFVPTVRVDLTSTAPLDSAHAGGAPS